MELPIKFNKNKIAEIHEKFLKKMLLERNAYSPPFDHNGAWWTRCSAQIWNEVRFFLVLVCFFFVSILSLLMRMSITIA